MRLVRPPQAPSEPTPRAQRGPWCPNREPYVLGSCGCPILPWGLAQTLKELVSKAFCDTHGWVTIKRKKITPADFLGLTIPDLPVNPPF